MRIPHLFTYLSLFVAACGPSSAMISVGNVSVDRAGELGIELRAKPGGPKHAWIELEFKPVGPLSKFRHVSLEIPDGDELGLGWTPLKDSRTSSGSVVVRVMGSRQFLKKVTLRIVCGELRSETGLDLRVGDFVDLEKLTKNQSAGGAEKAVRDGADPPATAPELKSEGGEKFQPGSNPRHR